VMMVKCGDWKERETPAAAASQPSGNCRVIISKSRGRIEENTTSLDGRRKKKVQVPLIGISHRNLFHRENGGGGNLFSIFTISLFNCSDSYLRRTL
jgi:hypothetical protein